MHTKGIFKILRSSPYLKIYHKMILMRAYIPAKYVTLIVGQVKLNYKKDQMKGIRKRWHSFKIDFNSIRKMKRVVK